MNNTDNINNIDSTDNTDRSGVILDVRGLRCAFPAGGKREVEVLHGVDITVHKGEVLGLVGESGSGKTLTMRSVTGILPPLARISAEKIEFSGKNLFGETEKAMRAVRGRQIAMIFQDPMTSLNPLRRVGYHIEEVIRRRESQSRRTSRDKALGASEIRAEALASLAKVGLPPEPHFLRRYPHELSGGQRQRVLIAMALSCKPGLLIADEPTTALDVTIQAQILSLLRGLQRSENLSIVLITHDLAAVASVAHRVAVMYGGLIMEEAPAAELFTGALHPYTRALLRSIPRIEDFTTKRRLSAIEGQPPSPESAPKGCPFAPRCTEARPECSAALPPVRAASPSHISRCVRLQSGAAGGL